VNPVDGVGHALVFPDSHHGPTSCGQRIFVCEITSTVRVKFASPPLSVCFREGGMLGTSVPKTTVNEHCHASAGENDVGLAAKTGDRAAVFEEAEAGPVQYRP